MKSFSRVTKEELFKEENSNNCCSLAEFGGMLLFGTSISRKEIKLVTESSAVLERYAALCGYMGCSANIKRSDKASARYAAIISDAERIDEILKSFGLIDADTGIIKYRILPDLVANECCKRAFIRGAFMSGGSVIDPNKNYNLEIVTPYMGLNRDFSKLLLDVGFEFKTVLRKSKYVSYTKKSENIADFLTYIGAYKSQMQFLNVKIEKEIHNDFNRTVNIETANLDKTIEASVKQIQAIEAVDDKIGIDNLPEELREIARLRLLHKSVSLADLGRRLTPPLGKSGVNHRLNKIIAMAEKFDDMPKE